MREDTGLLIPSSTSAPRASDCVDPAVLKAFNELTELDGGKHPTKGVTDWNRNPESKSPVTSHHTQLLSILSSPSGMTHELKGNILTNQCYWQPILKEKEYVDEDSSCILRCKDGAIQNGSQPYCKTPPDFEYSSGYNVGYLNPYLNPEWDLNNFSCTAIEDEKCSPANTKAGEGVMSVTRTWNESKQMYETRIQRCGDPEVVVNIFGMEIGAWGVLILGLILSVCACGGFAYLWSDSANHDTRIPESDGIYAVGFFCFIVIYIIELVWGRGGRGARFVGNLFILISLIVTVVSVRLTANTSIGGDGANANDWNVYADDNNGFGQFFPTLMFCLIGVYVGGMTISSDWWMDRSRKVGSVDGADDRRSSEAINMLKDNLVSELYDRANKTHSALIISIILFGVAMVLTRKNLDLDDAGTKAMCTILLPTGFLTLYILLSVIFEAFGLDPFAINVVEIGQDPDLSREDTFNREAIPAYKCHQYSDCKYHDNCLWDEIVSIIDGPQDYEFVSNHELDPGYTMTELMYGFIYLINKYDNNTEKHVYFRPKSDARDYEYTWEDLFKNPEQFIGKNSDGSTGGGGSNFNLGAGADLDKLSDTSRVKLVKWVDSWRFDTTKVLLDNNGNDITIKELLKEYGITDLGDSTTVGASVLRKVFWYYWSYFYNGANDNNNRSPGLRPEITDMWAKKYAIKTSGSGSTVDYYPGHNVGDFYNKLISKNDDMEVTPEEVRKCIPVIRIILKDWLYNNLLVKFNEESNGNGKFKGCELINKVCTFGVNEKTGECNETCENDELLDYSHGLCHSLSLGGDADANYLAHMEHVSAFTPDMGEKSLREFGPNFQRFYCEMEKADDGDREVILSDDKYYQKKGCIKNDFLNHNAIPGESCGEYASRSESAGYNIDCNHSNSRVHYQYYQSFNNLPNENNMEGKACHDSLAPGTSLEDKQKVCGYDFNGTSHLTANFEWQDERTISTSYKDKTRQVTQNPITSQFANPTGYEDISPILSCCSATTDEKCLIGNWIKITSPEGGSDIGYCSTKYSSSDQELTGGVDISTMATDLGLLNTKQACSLFDSSVNVPGCDTCSTYTCHSPNKSKEGVGDTSIAGELDPELICCDGPNCGDPGTCQTAAFGVDPGNASYTPESSCPTSGRCPTIPTIPTIPPS
jgi:hypothetical protein